jgi:uncharacterized protein (DUF1499 family)
VRRLAPAVLVAVAMHVPTPAATLAPCPPGARNCVSTEAGEPRQAMPAVPFADAPDAALARARAALLAEPRTRIVRERPGYLKAEARSRVLGFVDDVELVVDAAARVFRFRSASRVGRGDLGVNRKRMERVSARLAGATRRAR